MKQPKRLTLEQKKCLRSHGMRTEDWALVTETEFYYSVINKSTGAKKMVDKFKR